MPNEKGNRYAIHALKDRRATMAGEIVQMKEGVAYREEQLSHLDAVLRELDPSYRADTIPPKRLRRVKLFSNGELNRLIADALRRAEKPLASSDVADAIVEAKGYGRDSIHALTRRSAPTSPTCSATSGWLRPGDRLTARWSLPDETKESAN